MYFEPETGYLVITWADSFLANFSLDFMVGYTFGFVVAIWAIAVLNRTKLDWSDDEES